MRPGQQQQNKRMRGRGRKGPNPMSRSYESNGPDVKIRGTAQHVAEKYHALARDASASGDRVMAENYLQHAEHYGRIVAAAQGSFQLQRDESDLTDLDYEDGEEEGGFENGATNGHAHPLPGERSREDRPQGQDQGQNPHSPQNPQHQMRENRGDRREDRGNRDFRDNNNRDDRGNRDGNRENRFNNRDDRQNRDRNFNRDRDGNRNFRNDDRQNRDRPTPVGLGPQPYVGEAPVAAPRPEEAQSASFGEAPAREERVIEERPAAAEAPQTFEPAAPQPAPADTFASDAETGEAAPRRRGRPRRVRLGEEAAALAAAPAPPVAPATAPAPAPVARAASDPAPEAVSAEGEKVKRRPGRPRKKKADEGGEEPSDLPAFLLASNG